MVNIAKLDEVLAHIDDHPEEYDQRFWIVWQRDRADWRCGTTACVAGRAALLAGWVPVDHNGYVGKDGQTSFVSEVAMGLLGLSDHQAMNLFHARTEATMREVADYIRANPNDRRMIGFEADGRPDPLTVYGEEEE